MTCGTRGCSQMGYYADQYTARGKMYLVTQGNEHGPYCGKCSMIFGLANQRVCISVGLVTFPYVY